MRFAQSAHQHPTGITDRAQRTPLRFLRVLSKIFRGRLFFLSTGDKIPMEFRNHNPRHRIMLAFGTRPEAIKLSPLYHALRAAPEYFETLVCVTGQHRRMLDQVLGPFGIVPDIDLDLMRPGQDLFDVMASVLLGMRGVLQEYRPRALLVQGDTTTTLAAAMAGFYQGIPVGHVEAGLRVTARVISGVASHIQVEETEAL
ncbi:MAG: UDP-N-acetylglucosamine 2-epimerase, partial [Candidatus Kentron sp. G]